MVVALGFESKLAKKIERRHERSNRWITYVGAAIAIFLVINLSSGTLGAPHAVVHVGSQDSVAKYIGQFDGKSGVMMFGVLTVQDWVCLKLPFKGHLSDISSISFNVFVAQAGGQESLEPYVVIRMSEGKNLVCHPSDSYASGDWWLPLSQWQLRDVVVHGRWSFAPVDTESLLLPLGEWMDMIGDGNVLSINIYVGSWDLTSAYQCYVGDVSINGSPIGLSNVGRCVGPSAELPAGF